MANHFSFPNSYHLLIVTHSSVLAWNQAGLTPIFSSGPAGGILAAKKAANDTGLLAIADSQVVILHDIQRGRDKNYRFRGTEGEIRLPKFSPDSQTLSFSTTLHHSVQTYSSPQHVLLCPAYTYPSSPTVLAVGAAALLSASARPPTLYPSPLAAASLASHTSTTTATTIYTAPLLTQPP